MRLSVNLTGALGYEARPNWSIYEGDDGALEGPPSRDCLATSILACRATLRRSRVCARDPADRNGCPPRKQGPERFQRLRGIAVLQRGSIHQSLIKTSEIGVARKSPERRPPRRIEFELGCSLVMLLNLIPGDNIPNCLQIVGTPILVEEIVRVLPDIDPENCLKTITYWVILVRGGNDFE